MLDIKMVREQPEVVRQRLLTRGPREADHLDELLSLDERRRDLLARAEALKSERNRVSKEIGGLIGQGRHDEAGARKNHTRALGEEIAALDGELGGIEQQRQDLLLRIPNLPHASVAVGRNAGDNPVIRSWGEPAALPFKPRSHLELCESLRLVDFARASKLAGSGFLLFTHWGARLERALIQFLLDLHTREHGYVEVSPPFIVNRDCMIGSAQFPKFIDQAYSAREGLDGPASDALFLIPTAEVPVTNIHRDEILAEGQLPIYYCAYSPCFRAEAGAAGVGTRGMIRVHQFDKVELIKIARPETSYAELETMVEHAERVLQRLELHYRVVVLCTGDMGFGSAKTYDIEVWAPGQGSYLEVSSCSNFEDFQARRMNLRFKRADGRNEFPHILNGSGTALARLFVAILETCQQADGSILVPAALRPYLGTDRIAASPASDA